LYVKILGRIIDWLLGLNLGAKEYVDSPILLHVFLGMLLQEFAININFESMSWLNPYVLPNFMKRRNNVDEKVPVILKLLLATCRDNTKNAVGASIDDDDDDDDDDVLYIKTIKKDDDKMNDIVQLYVPVLYTNGGGKEDLYDAQPFPKLYAILNGNTRSLKNCLLNIAFMTCVFSIPLFICFVYVPFKLSFKLLGVQPLSFEVWEFSSVSVSIFLSLSLFSCYTLFFTRTKCQVVLFLHVEYAHTQLIRIKLLMYSSISRLIWF
jgi:hypothetical protein